MNLLAEAAEMVEFTERDVWPELAFERGRKIVLWGNEFAVGDVLLEHTDPHTRAVATAARWREPKLEGGLMWQIVGLPFDMPSSSSAASADVALLCYLHEDSGAAGSRSGKLFKTNLFCLASATKLLAWSLVPAKLLLGRISPDNFFVSTRVSGTCKSVEAELGTSLPKNIFDAREQAIYHSLHRRWIVWKKPSRTATAEIAPLWTASV